MKVSQSKQPLPAKIYVCIALVGIVVFFALLFVYLRWLPVLAERGESNFVRYILLVILGLEVSVILHAVMRSSSSVSYEEQGLSVKLGGAAAVCFLIVWGGIKVIPDTPQTFDVTVRPQSNDEKSSIITSGTMMIDLDSDRRAQRISPNGETDFKQIPWKFRGMTVNIRPQVDGYEETPQPVVLSGSVITLLLVKLPPPTTDFHGSIILPRGRIRNIKVLVEGQEGEATADKFGRFEMRVKGSPGDSVRVNVFIDGKRRYDDFQTLPGPVTIVPRAER